MLACAVGVGLVAGAAAMWEPEGRPVDVPPQAEVVVLGSSIAMADLDGDVLADALGLAPDAVASLGARAAQPAHWLATLRHQVHGAGVHPTHVVVVSPLDALLRERLRSDVDVERLLAQLSRPDPELWGIAVGDGGWDRFVARQATSARVAARGWLGGWLPTLLGWTDALAQARASASAAPRSTESGARWRVDPAAPRPGRRGDQPSHREPLREEPADWRLGALLVAEAERHGGQLWVVAPPVRPSDRGPTCARSRLDQQVAAALRALGAQVIDATDAPLAPEDFRTRYHLEGAAPAQLSRAVGAAMRGAPPRWTVCPTRDRGGRSGSE